MKGQNLIIRCIVSLSQAFLNNTELKMFGRHGKPNIFLKACERERKREKYKKRLRKKLRTDNCDDKAFSILS